MRIIPIQQVHPGMILAKNICNRETGQVLLRANIILKQSYIERIKNLQYNYLFIRDTNESDDAMILEPVKEETRFKAISLMKTTLTQLEQGKNIKMGQIKSVVREMIDQILVDSRIVFNIIDLNSHDNYTYTHSVNVAVLALLIGTVMCVNRPELEILGIGALMHDIGKIKIDPQIINKPAALDPTEFELIKEHSRNGFEILKSKIPISFLPAHMALQHHEREDGSGYPRGLKGKSIHRFAKIVAVADVFDAITSNRSYRKALPPFMGIREIINNINSKFDKNIVEYFIKIVAPYPIGSTLLLNNAWKVVVTNVFRTKCLVKVVEGPESDSTFDLFERSDLKVIELISNPFYPVMDNPLAIPT